MPEFRVRRVLSNNALIVSTAGENAIESVRVGKGIGFAKKPGDLIESPLDSREYVEISEQQRAVLDSLRELDDHLLTVISASIDLASDMLGDLHPSVYVILVEHIAFAVERTTRGEVIHNSLIAETRAVIPEEFHTAELIVHYLNTHLDQLDLPLDEAAYIALHLHAARSGASVKQPLAVANALGQATATVRQLLGDAGDQDALSMELAMLLRRLKQGRLRANALQRDVEKRLPKEFDVANRIIANLLNQPTTAPEARGEAAFLAMFLHGWTQNI
ncbi:PRD domain-containing protein [Corynebacterium hindlerae]|uniref:PRD domain-containing protein n=1 Tax=Corynebacterium hindlerae TaxID=699041 RepID=UPI003AACDECC